MGGWWRLDEVIEPSLQPDSSMAQKDVSMAPTSVEQKANDDDHEASDQVNIDSRRSTRTRTTSEWYTIVSSRSCC